MSARKVVLDMDSVLLEQLEAADAVIARTGARPKGTLVVGAALGYGYHRFVGCSSGACPITANPYISTVYGAVMGYLASGAR